MFLIFGGNLLASIWIDSQDTINLSKSYLRINGYSLIFQGFSLVLLYYFIIIGKVILILIYPVLQSLILVIVTLIFYETGKNDSLRMMYASPVSYITFFILVLVTYLFIDYGNQKKQNEEQNSFTESNSKE
jgi:Na+-driven multidrug efflux pump